MLVIIGGFVYWFGWLSIFFLSYFFITFLFLIIFFFILITFFFLFFFPPFSSELCGKQGLGAAARCQA